MHLKKRPFNLSIIIYRLTKIIKKLLIYNLYNINIITDDNVINKKKHIIVIKDLFLLFEIFDYYENSVRKFLGSNEHILVLGK